MRQGWKPNGRDDRLGSRQPAWTPFFVAAVEPDIKADKMSVYIS